MIYLDDFIFSLQAVGGISIYWLEVLKMFNEYNNESITLLKRRNNQSIVYSSDFWKKSIKYEIQLPLKLARLLPILNRIPSKSLFHSSYLRFSFQKDICNIITIHDLAAELKMITGWRRLLKMKLQEIAIKKADGIICVSESTKESLLNHYSYIESAKVKTIYHGCSDEFEQLKEPSLKSEQISVLFIGSRSYYKNFSICVEVLQYFKEFRLLIVGGGELSLEEIKHLKSKIGDRYTFIKEVSTKELNLIYNKVFCLFYPTLYEGFGFPVVEAMKSGCPVISSNISAIKEIGQNALILVENPKKKDEFINAIKTLLNDSIRQQYIARGLERAKFFSWEKHFLETKKFYNEVYSKKFNMKLFKEI